ncbi:hypothetical protein D3875_04390 [Deinococcus cavernae]|uniref:Uncharacterized protein n=1 Tax=Deinococcus cavernae TaxID=2320857 RepID=A0A418VEI9_9DEIO|nr:hypothetical protein [Deinococcus cavernae]RJF74524.1 hypothetical protein D3875_04390 [Deinococcus cavernae]
MMFPVLRYTALRQLVHILVDGPSGYRTARNLEAYFARLGYASPLLKTESRIDYVARVIEEAQQRGQSDRLLEAVIQAEAAQDARASLQRLISDVLSPYGWTIQHDDLSGFRVQPLVIQAAPVTPDVLEQPDFGHVFLTDEEGTVLRNRWTEAVVLYHAGAWRMGCIALSTILEHMLVACLQAYPDSTRASREAPQHLGAIREWRLDVLLAIANERGWMTLSAAAFPYRVRHYRDYVTPAHELREGDAWSEALIGETWRNVKRTIEELHDRTGAMLPITTRTHSRKALQRAQLNAAYKRRM